MGDEYKIVPTDKTWLSIQTEDALPIETISEQLLVLQTAFPTIVRNYDEYEVQALQQLWYDIFKNVPEQLMREAIKRFIINDRKGFFPSPGQIVGEIEQIVAEQKEAELMKRLLEHQEAMLEYDRLVEKGENCSNCEFCRRETEYGSEKMFCKNAQSINYEGTRKVGVSKSLRCEFFNWAKAAIEEGEQT